MGTDTKGKKGKKKHLSYILGGKILTEDFIIKHSVLILLTVCLFLVFITNRYHCAKKLSELHLLKTELTELKNEQVVLIQKLTILSRQSSVEEALREKGSELSKKNVTVYEIRK